MQFVCSLVSYKLINIVWGDVTSPPFFFISVTKLDFWLSIFHLSYNKSTFIIIFIFKFLRWQYQPSIFKFIHALPHVYDLTNHSVNVLICQKVKKIICLHFPRKRKQTYVTDFIWCETELVNFLNLFRKSASNFR